MIYALLLTMSFSQRIRSSTLSALSLTVLRSMTGEVVKSHTEKPLYTPELLEYAKLFIYNAGSDTYSIILSEFKEMPPVLEYGKGVYRFMLFPSVMNKLKVSKLVYAGNSHFYLYNIDEGTYFDVQFLKNISYKHVKSNFLYKYKNNKNESKWKSLINNGFKVESIRQIDSVPTYLWSYGCSPTSSAMIMGYWDMRGYGRLVDYYFEHHDVAINQEVYNVPNVQRELAIEMNTDTTTGGTSLYSIASGNTGCTNNLNGYAFTSQMLYGGTNYSTAYNYLKQEIDAGRPVHFAVINYDYEGQSINHSTCAVGYKVTATDTYVILHNTWDHGTWSWPLHSGNCYLYVYSVVPSGYNATNLQLDQPQQFFVNGLVNQIGFSIQNADSVTNMKFYVSFDRGESWFLLSEAAPVSPYLIRLNFPGYNTLRIKASLFNTNSEEMAGDGFVRAIDLLSIQDTVGIDICAFYSANPTGKSVFFSDSIPFFGTTQGIFEIDNVGDTVLFKNRFMNIPCYSADAYGNYSIVGSYNRGYTLLKADSVIYSDTTGTYIEDVAIADSFAALFERDKGCLLVNYRNPVIKDTIETGYYAMRGELHSHYVYIGSLTSGLRIYDITNLQQTDSLLSGRIYDIASDGARLYVLGQGGIIYIYDLGNPSNPQFCDSISTDNVTGIRVQNGYLILVKGQYGLTVLSAFSFAELAHISGVGTITDAWSSGNDLYFVNTDGVLFYGKIYENLVKTKLNTLRPTYGKMLIVKNLLLVPILSTGKHINIYDTEGRLALSGVIPQNGRVDITDLKNGFYSAITENKRISFIKIKIR